jgi:cis-3-alkyl-4-acyloxetan-2-one decarboxylase
MSAFRPAPDLPAWLQRMLPQRRQLYVLQRGADAGRALHFIDHGEGPAVVLLHGNPTWCFLWREVIARLPDMRCVAPDLLGLGLSDKPPALADHTVDRHADALAELIEALDLTSIVLVGQDWGGPLAAAVGARLPDRVAGVVLANTSVLLPSRPRGTWFHRLARVPVVSDLLFRGLGLPQAALWVAQGDRASIRGDVARAYRWPLRRLADRVAPLALARLVASEPSLPPLRRAEAWIRGFSGPIALVWGERDPILGRALARHVKAFPQATVTRTQAGHFLQEEVPDKLADAVVDVARRAGLLPAA